MSKLHVTNSLVVNTSASTAWDIIGPNFLNIAEWARGINKSWNNDSVNKNFDAAPAGGRFCDVAGFGKFDERIIHFDNENHEITWSATAEKLPGFVKDLQNAITVEHVDDNSCRVTTSISANLTGIRGFLLGAIMKKTFSKTVQGFLKDWKTYAETGEVSETKHRELSRA